MLWKRGNSQENCPDRNAYQDSGNEAGNHQDREIPEKGKIGGDKICDQNLADVVRGSAGCADAGFVKFSSADEQNHDENAEHGAAHAVRYTEQISEEKTDHHDSGGGYEHGFPPAEQQKHDQDDHVAEP